MPLWWLVMHVFIQSYTICRVCWSCHLFTLAGLDGCQKTSLNSEFLHILVDKWPLPYPHEKFLYVPLSDDVVPLLKIQSYLICVELILNICFFFIDRFWYKLGNFLMLHPKILPNPAIVIYESYFIGLKSVLTKIFGLQVGNG